MITTKRGIYVFSPANTMADMSSQGIEIGIRNLNNLGFEVIFGGNASKKSLYTAGTIGERLEDLNYGLNHPEVAIMMPVFGGYNSNQLIELLDYPLVKKQNKIFVGYSDTIILLNAIFSKTGIITIYGPSFASFCNPNLQEEVAESFVDIINDKSIEYVTPKQAACDLWYMKDNLGPREFYQHPEWTSLSDGVITGHLVGGNLDSFISLLGTEYLPNLEGAILLVESSMDEHPGRFDRHMTQLQLAGVFNKIKGMVIGQFPIHSPLSQENIISQIVDRVIRPNNFPIICNTSFSHVDPILCLPIGGKVKIEALGKKCNIILHHTC